MSQHLASFILDTIAVYQDQEEREMNFAETLKKFRIKASKSRYGLAKYSGINQAYIHRLEKGERDNPSRDVVLMLGFALVAGSDSVAIWDIDELLMSAGYAPLRKRGGAAA